MPSISRLGLIVLFAFSTLLLTACAPTGSINSGSDDLSRQIAIADTTISVGGGDFQFRGVSAKFNGSETMGEYFANESELSGIIVNGTDRVYSIVTFDMVAYSSMGTQMARQEVFLAIPNSSFVPGSSYDLSQASLYELHDALGPRTPTRFEIENADGRSPVSYSFEMVEPDKNSSLNFSDDDLSIAFALTKRNIGFALENTSDQPIRIKWDEIAYVDPSGTSHRTMHNGVKYSERNNPQSPTTVPPGARIEDVLVPSDKVRYSDILDEWVEGPILPAGNTATQQKGNTFQVFMPLEVGGETSNYTFKFKITDVRYQTR